MAELPPRIDAPPERIREFEEKQARYAALQARDAEVARKKLLRRCPHPLALALYLEPQATVSVPAMEWLSRVWVDVFRADAGRAVISTPSQIGKTTLVGRWATFWAMLANPSLRVMYGSYSVTLASDTGREVRRLVETYGEEYGLYLDRSRYDASDWYLQRVEGWPRAGRHVCISPDSRATGIPCDYAALDDVYSGEQEAHSPAVTRHVEQWWESTVRLRLGPSAPVVAIGTRFAEHDILARFLGEGWSRVNIPALADGHAHDSVSDVEGARTEDGYLVTTRGTTPAGWKQMRAEVTERVWTSTAQGSPTAPEGNLFKREHWNRIEPDQLPRLVKRVIACDPAETGLGDAAGILVGGRAQDGQLYLLADLSDQLSQAQWGRRLCVGLVRWSCESILAEKTLGMSSTIRDAWAIIQRQATALRANELDVDRAQAALSMASDRQAMDSAELAELVDIVGDVLALPSSGPRVTFVTPRQNKRVRAEAVTGLWELGRAHVVGRLPLLEHEAQAWNPDAQGRGGKSPNRVDVMAHLLTHLDVAGAGTTISSPAGSRALPSGAPAPRVPTRSGARGGMFAVIDGGAAPRPGSGGPGGGLPTRMGARSRRGGVA